jgi:hypothetical protein
MLLGDENFKLDRRLSTSQSMVLLPLREAGNAFAEAFFARFCTPFSG